MVSRPLFPALGATIIGILIGHHILTNVYLPRFILPLAIVFLLAILVIVPLKVHPLWLIPIFSLIGINSQITRPLPSWLQNLANENKRVVIEGTVNKPPNIGATITTLSVHAEKIFLHKEVRRVKVNLLARVYGYKNGLRVGTRIRFPAKLKEFKSFYNPGSFDYRFYMQSRGFCFTAIVTDGRYVVPMGKGDLGFTGEMLERVRRPLRGFFRERLPYRTNVLYTALILGERQSLTSKVREPFDRSGVGHIMAVSGLHLGLVAWLFFTSLRRLLSLSYRITLMVDIRKLAAVITALPVIGYGFLTGFQLSSQRAVVMILVFLWSIIIGRERDVWSSLSLAALIILSLSGDSLLTTSFQLSFVAVAGILWLTPLIYPLISRSTGIAEPSFQEAYSLYVLLKYAIGMISVTIAATAITIPLIAYHFHRFSVLAVPANLTVVPIIGLCVVPLGLLSSVALSFSHTLAGILLSAGGFGLNLAISMVQFWSSIPWSSIWVIRPHWLEILLLYGSLFLGLNFTRARAYRILLALLLTVFIVDIGYWVHTTRLTSNLRVTILDVGRCNAAFIQFPGKERMLITHNVFGPRGFNLPRVAIAPYLWHKKITRIDYLFLEDPHMVQTEKLRFITNNFHPREVLTNLSKERMISGVHVKEVKKGGISLYYRGWSFLFSGQNVQIERYGPEGRKGLQGYLITTKETVKPCPVSPIVRIDQTGALTVTVGPGGDLKVRSFLRTNLPQIFY
jgi:competence protein ComEC